ncbi:cytochrome c assembly protein [Psychromonas ingrahamii 37]|uniref:Cytochrome c assembly protein n=1 Tax=Psychromonas ingrahamii (strain DSM 17664 / CCUG 51855 / 37) TaxID=357804 RepID=A1SZZ0_PSYIN|nr:cytochrome c biogenesis protein CcsA [Psychromonas ingrahamii]ABM05055.1 cytochrome c assembly protein [Psychromonas ingrahamii 37]
MDYWALIVATFYLIGGGLAVNILFNRTKPFYKCFIGSTIIALSTHVVWLYQNIFLLNGQNLPMLNVVSLIGFLIALLTAIMGKRLNTGVLLPVIYGFNIINFIAVAYFPSHFITHLEIHPAIGSHIILALLAYAILSIASLFALQLAYINYRLKNHKRPLAMTNMPPLMTLEKSLFQFIFIGFILLSCTLITGFIFLEDMFAQGKAHKAILSIIAWIIYAILLWGHYTKGWRGQLIVYITIVASSFLTLAYFGSRFVREIILS